MFQGQWSIGSREEDFLRFLPYMGMAAKLVMWPRHFEQFFFPKGPGGCIWNLVAIGPVVSEEKSFEIVDGRTDDWRRTDDGACLYYKLPRSLRLRWAKNGREGVIAQTILAGIKCTEQIFSFSNKSRRDIVYDFVVCPEHVVLYLKALYITRMHALH